MRRDGRSPRAALGARCPPPTRSRKIWALAELIDANGEELAHLESLDNGKPVKLARYVDVAESSGQLRYFAGWPTKIEGNVIPISAPDTLCYTRASRSACAARSCRGTSRC